MAASKIAPVTMVVTMSEKPAISMPWRRDPEQQHGHDDAGDAALAAEDADAPEHDHGDGGEEQDVTHVGADGAVIGGEHDAG